MYKEEFFHLVEKYFGYLISKQGFNLVHKQKFSHFDNQEVIFQSDACRIRVYVDRGEVYADVAPLSPEEHCWIDLGTLIAYLKGNELDDSYDRIETPRHGDRMARLEPQVRQIAALLLDYCTQICALFSSKELDQLCDKLKKFGLQRSKKLARLE
ncbi:MAG: hypothetical protein RML36_17215 [Anaerolineae bacterium]|nr:hypothetical protein [Anaerolineae bacterium]MDW8101215.1 hypothetical protein [Anaerolineae bacterium]